MRNQGDVTMKIGIIGAGPIGATLSHKLNAKGHHVKVADARTLSRLKDKDIAGEAVALEQLGQDIDILIISLPLAVVPEIKEMVSQLNNDVIIVDTTNYYPFRDAKITEIEEGMPESVWVSEQLGRDVIKAFNNQLAYTLAQKGSAQKGDSRIAMAVAGNDDLQKEIIMNIVDEVGFDAVDNGSFQNSWRQQPGTPAYCTELTSEDMKKALEIANKATAPKQRDEVGKHFEPGMTHEDIVQLNRQLYKVN